MDTYTLYIEAYANGDMKTCAKLLHDLINLRMYRGVDFPAVYLATFQFFLEEMYRLGAPVPTREGFDQMWQYMHYRIVVGHPNSEKNN